MIYLVERVDFDEMENDDPISRTIVGYAATEAEAADAVAKLDRQTPKRMTGWRHRREYPYFEIERVQLVPGSVVRDPLSLAPGARIEIERPKSGTPPDVNHYELLRRDGASWLMVGGSVVPDTAPCWTDGRVRIIGAAPAAQ